MNPYIDYLNDFYQKNSEEYPDSGELNYISYEKSYAMEQYRSNIINSLEDKLKWTFKDTKPILNNISKGCMLCGQGEWSCLFITGLCNANCFYCPAKQDSDHMPETQLLSFDNPLKYAKHFHSWQLTDR